MAKYIVGIIFIILVTGAGYYFFAMKDGGKGAPLNTVSYVCSENKTISASYYKDSVDIVLSDGRNFSLPQAQSASGARYASADESMVFWNKGQGAFITENGNPEVQTFTNCGEGAPTAPVANIFTNASSTFSVTYPDGWTPNGAYAYTGVSAAKPIAGVQFIVPTTMATGTNLSSDTYVSVEQLPRATSCVGDIYIKDNVKPSAIDANGHSYSLASTTGAGAGNRYEEWVFAIPGSSPCTAVRYFIHYGVFENYPQDGSVKEFDRAALLAAFDSIRDSVTVTAPAATTPAATTTTP